DEECQRSEGTGLLGNRDVAKSQGHKASGKERVKGVGLREGCAAEYQHPTRAVKRGDNQKNADPHHAGLSSVESKGWSLASGKQATIPTRGAENRVNQRAESFVSNVRLL